MCAQSYCVHHTSAMQKSCGLLVDQHRVLDSSLMCRFTARAQCNIRVCYCSNAPMQTHITRRNPPAKCARVAMANVICVFARGGLHIINTHQRAYNAHTHKHNTAQHRSMCDALCDSANSRAKFCWGECVHHVSRGTTGCPRRVAVVAAVNNDCTLLEIRQTNSLICSLPPAHKSHRQKCAILLIVGSEI